MNNNKPINLIQNQIIRCIICHIETIGLEILALCIKCHKQLIAYHKCNAIIAMKKHADIEHGALLKRYVEKVTFVLGLHLNMNQPLNVFMLPNCNFWIFLFTNEFTKDHETQIVFLENVISCM